MGSTGFIEVDEKFTVRKAVFAKDGYVEIQSIGLNIVYHLSHAEFSKAFPAVDLDNITFFE